MFDYRKVLNGHMASELVDGLNIFTTHSSLERGYFLEWVETTNWLSILGIWRQCVGSWDIMGLVRSMTETCVMGGFFDDSMAMFDFQKVQPVEFPAEFFSFAKVGFHKAPWREAFTNLIMLFIALNVMALVFQGGHKHRAGTQLGS